MVAGATHLIAGASGAILDCGVCFPSEFFVMTSTFTLGQVLNFGSLAYIADSYGELRPLKGAAPAGTEHLVLPPPPGLLGVDLKVLARQI
jgi:hypothetical protein